MWNQRSDIDGKKALALTGVSSEAPTGCKKTSTLRLALHAQVLPSRQQYEEGAKKNVYAYRAIVRACVLFCPTTVWTKRHKNMTRTWETTLGYSIKNSMNSPVTVEA